MKKGGILLIVLILLGLIGLASTAFTVRETEQALVLQFGEPRRLLTEPGLHFKIPFVQEARFFDRRVLDYDADAREIPTSDQKQVLVDAFARYRIVDPLEFFKTVNNELRLQQRLNTVVDNSLRDVLGDASLATVMTPKRADLMNQVTAQVRTESQKFGLDVIDVRIKRIDLPEENSQAIYRRMKTQREQAARNIRAQGEKEARRIRADAEKQKRVTIAEAKKKAEILRGEGDGEAEAIYNAAYGQDESFFDFWRSMQAMRKGLGGESTSFVGPPTGDFFRYFDTDVDLAE